MPDHTKSSTENTCESCKTPCQSRLDAARHIRPSSYLLAIICVVAIVLACSMPNFETAAAHEVNGDLKDASGRLLGRIKQRGSGMLEIRDKKNRLAGTYDFRSNATRDASGRLVGRGNLLSALVAGCI